MQTLVLSSQGSSTSIQRHDDSEGCLQLAAALTASYIGGSINFAAVSASLAAPGPLIAAAMAAGMP